MPYVALFGLLVLPYFVRLYVMPCMAAAGRPQAALPGLAIMLAFIVVGMATVGRMSLMLASLVIRTQLLGTACPLLASLVMIGAVMAERAFVLPGLPLPVRLPAIALLGSIVYGGIMLLFDRPMVMRLIDFAKSAVSRPGAAASDGEAALS